MWFLYENYSHIFSVDQFSSEKNDNINHIIYEIKL